MPVTLLMASPGSLVTPGNKGNNSGVQGKLVAQQETALLLMPGFYKYSWGLMIEQISDYRAATALTSHVQSRGWVQA